MKLLITTFVLFFVVMVTGADLPKKGPIPVWGQKKLAEVNPETGKVTLEKDASADEVMTILVGRISALQEELNKCVATKKK